MNDLFFTTYREALETIHSFLLLRQGFFSLRHRIHTGSDAHPVSYPTGTGGSFSRGKAAGAWSLPFASI